jgi:hypothetical protein
MKPNTLRTVKVMKHQINTHKAYFYEDNGVQGYTYPSRGWIENKWPCTEEELEAEIKELDKYCRIIIGKVHRL